MDGAEFDAAFGFPSEFPYEFDAVGTEPVDSGSTGTESSDDEDFFAGLTRRLSHTSLNETRKEQHFTVPIGNSGQAEVMITNTHRFLPFFHFSFRGS